MTAASILAPGGAPTHPQNAGRALIEIAKQAASKGFRLHHCVPLTGLTPEYWMIQRGSSMQFFETLESLRTAVDEMSEWRCLSPEAEAKEADLRAALAELNEGAEGGAA